MANPDYLAIYNQIQLETDPDIIAGLVASLYTFETALTDEEIKIFEYVLDANDYVTPNPGYDVDDNFVSYVGNYFSEDGEVTQ